ncbi:MAG: hypothetical protein IPM46_01150 [Flavobacteriales bacterium]|nr:hypothetical protein [Flavobacteriales bacterium]
MVRPLTLALAMAAGLAAQSIESIQLRFALDSHELAAAERTALLRADAGR